MNLLRSFGIDLVLYATSKSLVAVASVGVVGVLASQMEPGQYAVYWQIFTLVSGAATIATTGLVTALRRYYAHFELASKLATYRRTAISFAGWNVLIATLVFVPIYLVGSFLGHWGLSPTRLLLSSFAFVSAIVFIIYSGHLMASRRIGLYLITSVCQAALFFGLAMTALGKVNLPLVDGAIALLCVSYLAVMAPCFVFRQGRELAPEAEETREWRREFFFLGQPLAIMNGALLVSNLGTQFAVALIVSNHEAGIYAAFSAPIERLLGFAASVAAMALLPILSSLWDQKRRSEVNYLLGLTMVGVMVFGSLFTFILIVFGQKISSMFIGANYTSGAELIPLLCAASTASALAAVLADLLVIRRQTLDLAISFSVASGVGLLVTFVGAAMFGAEGAAFGRLVAGLVAITVIVFMIRRRKASDIEISVAKSLRSTDVDLA